LEPHRGRYYFTSHFLTEITDAAVDALVDVDASRRPNPRSLIVIRTRGGAVARVGA
jgi:hypothetical protein